jgi:hypothetical protein
MCGKKTCKKEIEKTIKEEVNESLHEKVKIDNIKTENVSDEEELSDDAIFECTKNDCECQTSFFDLKRVFSACWY